MGWTHALNTRWDTAEKIRDKEVAEDEDDHSYNGLSRGRGRPQLQRIV